MAKNINILIPLRPIKIYSCLSPVSNIYIAVYISRSFKFIIESRTQFPRTFPLNTHQPQRIHPPRGVGHVLVAVESTRQFDRVGGQVAAGVGIVVAMAVVV